MIYGYDDQEKDRTRVKLRTQIEHALKEESKILKELTKAKQTCNWLKENKCPIPDKLMIEIDYLGELKQKNSRQLEQVIRSYDSYISEKGSDLKN